MGQAERVVRLVTLPRALSQWDGWFLVLCIGGFLALLGLIGLTVYKVCAWQDAHGRHARHGTCTARAW